MNARPGQGPLITFAIFALAGPWIGAFLLFLPNAINVFRWIATDGTYFWLLLNSVWYVYPFGVWPGLVAGAIGGVIWIAAFELFVFQLGTKYLFSELNLWRTAICAAAAMACWRLSRAPQQAA